MQKAIDALIELRRLGVVTVDQQTAIKMKPVLLKMDEVTWIGLDIDDSGLFTFKIITTPLFPGRFIDEQ